MADEQRPSAWPYSREQTIAITDEDVNAALAGKPPAFAAAIRGAIATYRAEIAAAERTFDLSEVEAAAQTVAAQRACDARIVTRACLQRVSGIRDNCIDNPCAPGGGVCDVGTS